MISSQYRHNSIDFYANVCYNGSMIRIWDFLMRRKPLFVVLLAVFVASCWLGGLLMVRTSPATPDKPSQNPAIAISTDSPENNVPPLLPYDTGSMVSIRVANPTPEELYLESLQNVSQATASTDPEKEIEVPLTSAPSDSAKHLAAWRSIVLQSSLALFLGALTYIFVSLAWRYFTERNK